MPKFEVDLIDTRYVTVTVEAEDAEAAGEMAGEAYNSNQAPHEVYDGYIEVNEAAPNAIRPV